MPGQDRPLPSFDVDRDTQANQIMALGLISGALTQSSVVGTDKAVVMSIVLAKTDRDHPRLFLRFPGVLSSEYEVTLHLVPGTDVTDVD